MIVIRKKMLLSAVLGLFFTLFLAIGVPVSITAFSPKPTYSFVIDAGHGGIDGGVVGKTTGVFERELNLEVAQKLASYFRGSGFGVTMTRKNERGLYDLTETSNRKLADMKKRAEIINKANPTAVISIHMNFYTSSVRRGSQVFYNRKNEAAVMLAKTIQATLNKNINLKYSGREYSALSGDYYLTECTNIPVVIVECGFLSNPLDEKLLIDNKYQLEIAYEIFSGVISYVMTL